jgi:putative colanic acid biosynthesis UDP-glucose lipid carrier transferase
MVFKVNSSHKVEFIHANKLATLARLLDVAVIAVTLWAILNMNEVAIWNDNYTWWLLISIVVFQIFAELDDLYQQGQVASIFNEVKLILISWFGVLIVIFCIDQVNLIIPPVFKHYFWMWAIAVPIELVSWHIISANLAISLRRMGKQTSRIAIVGATRLSYELHDIITQDQTMGVIFAGFFDDRQKMESDRVAISDTHKLSGNFKQLIEQTKNGLIDVIYIALPLKAEQRIAQLIEQLADSTATVYFVPDFFVFDLLRSSLHHIKGIPIVSVYDSPFYGVDGALKRVFDVVLGSIILTIIAIPMLIIAISVKITSPGPVLFKQHRYGLKGEEIVVWKFRSMSVCEDGANVQQAKKNDPRVTKLGAFLRRTSLDELPQFINVLQGHMSIVGPRPHAVAHNEWYRKQIKGYMLRHKVKPGITGLAQISGYRGETDTLEKMEGRVKYDLKYIKNWSLWLDIKIVFLTVYKGFTGSTAY